jgi:hypothetical protein
MNVPPNEPVHDPRDGRLEAGVPDLVVAVAVPALGEEAGG